MKKFNYDDIVKVSENAPQELRPGSKAWVIGIFEERKEKYFDIFPEGIVYSVEYEDGVAVDIHESYLYLFTEGK